MFVMLYVSQFSAFVARRNIKMDDVRFILSYIVFSFNFFSFETINTSLLMIMELWSNASYFQSVKMYNMHWTVANIKKLI